jgi:hypothetical protein
MIERATYDLLRVALCLAIQLWPRVTAWHRHLGSAPLLDVLRAPILVLGDRGGRHCDQLGCLMVRPVVCRNRIGPRLVRGQSDNIGHADWLAIRDVIRLSPVRMRPMVAPLSVRPTGSFWTALHSTSSRSNQQKHLGSGRHRC